MSAAERDVRASLERLGLADSHAELSLKPLHGGVSSRILRAMIGERRMRFKQALAQLNVEADWYAIQALSVTAPYAGSFVKFPR